MSHRPHAEPRGAYRHFMPIQTRWADNDAYGHVNNVVYYGWFDTAVNGYLIEAGALDIHAGEVIGLVPAMGAADAATVVGDDEADPANGMIAFSAPLARALMGAEVGELIEFAGREEAIEILAITAAA